MGKEIRHPWQLLYRVFRHVKPLMEKEYAAWYLQAGQIPDDELRKQALASMDTKKFHCQGGVVYAAQQLAYAQDLVPLIVAYQTISDYLDNLCDRSTSLDPDDFRQLHRSMQDALTPDAPLRDYYLYRTERNDGDYLAKLVQTCQHYVKKLPSYAQVQAQVLEFSNLYSDLQVYKHIAHADRESHLKAWWEKHRGRYPEIYWQEFSAVTGSTIGIFALFSMAAEKQLEEEQVITVSAAYFPWVCGLHILLDYLIDLEEDRLGGDLNFVSYYQSSEEAIIRLQYFVAQAKEHVAGLPNAAFHRMIVDGLVALYLADRKVNRKQSDIYTVAKELLRQARSLPAVLFYVSSLLVRR